MYTITLTDGQKIEQLGLNGTNYVSGTKVDESIFKENLKTMTISDGKVETTYHDMVFVQQMEYEGKFYLAFREKEPEEILEEQLKQSQQNVTDLQMALADVYELIIGGGM